MTPRDDELLDRLRSALQTAPQSPTADELAALRQLVREDPERPATVVGLHTRPRRHRARRVALAAALAATLLVGSAAVAVATNGPFSGTARRAASALGLPVDSPELSSAKNALAALRAALAGYDDRQIADARRDVDRRLAALSSDDTRDVNREARDLLREADERLGPLHDPGERGPSGGPRGDGGGAPNGDRGGTRDHGGSQGSAGGTDSSPNVAPSPSGSDSDGGGGGSAPTTLPGGSGTSGDDGGSSGGGSGSDGGSGSGH
jgi:hypothetical protein